MSDKIEALERLAKLRSDGVLNQDEYNAQKAALLSDHVPAASPRPAMTWAERWREGRERSRGIRRFVLWFYGIVGLIGLFIGIYYFARGHSLENAREAATNSPAVISADNTPAPASAEQAAADNSADDLHRQPGSDERSGGNSSIGSGPEQTIDISDETVRAEYKTSGSWSEVNTATACIGQLMTFHNATAKPLYLSVGPEEGSGSDTSLGTLAPGQSHTLSFAEARRYIISHASTADAGAAAVDLYLVKVIRCANQ